MELVHQVYSYSENDGTANTGGGGGGGGPNDGQRWRILGSL